MLSSLTTAVDAVAEFLHWQERFRDVEGYLHDQEGHALFRLAATGPGAGAIVEIGSFLGRSTAFLAAGSRSAEREKVVAVDHFRGSPEHQPGQAFACETLAKEGSTFPRFQANLKRLGLSEQVTPVVASSGEAASRWSGPVRLLFIDGDHSYEESRADFERWSGFVVPGGLIAFHDVEVWPGVTRFYRELMREAAYREVAVVRSLRVIEKVGPSTEVHPASVPTPVVIPLSGRAVTAPFDIAVVVPTVGRSTLERAIRSVFAQDFAGSIQILVGVDLWGGDRERLMALAREAPANRTVFVLDPGYSTSVRHGGFVAAQDGGALRTVLSYLAHSRRIAYLDDDNWWAPDHLSQLHRAITGHEWAFSMRWYVNEEGMQLSVDRWESVGPGRGEFARRFGGFVDPSCLMLDKAACEPALRLWCHPLASDPSGMSADRTVFSYLLGKRGVGTDTATVYYTLRPTDVNHAARMAWLAKPS